MDYRRQHQWYEKRWSLGEGYGGEKKVPNPEIKKFINSLRKDRRKVLDIGCGEGRHAILFAKAGFETYGLDFSRSAIKKAKANSKIANVSTNFKVGDGLNPPYRENYFDIILDSGFLHHLKKKDWKKYLQGIKRILKPEGIYLCVQLSKNSRAFHNFSPFNSKRNFYLTKNTYTYFFTKKDYLQLLGKDFKKIRIFESQAFRKERRLIYFLGTLSK